MVCVDSLLGTPVRFNVGSPAELLELGAFIGLCEASS